MVQLFTSTGRDFDSTMKCLNASTGEEYCESKGKWNSMVELLTASTGKEYCESKDKCNSKVKLFTSTGRDLDNREVKTLTVDGKRQR